MTSVPVTVALVEGHSDRIALETLAARLGRDLAAEGAEIVVMDGITNTRTFARRYGPLGEGLRLAGLYDAPEEERLRIGLGQAGIREGLGGDLASLGFFRCTADLEDELIRALGAEGVEAVIAAAGEAGSLRSLAQMPAQRGWTREAVLRRFFGSQSGRKAKYARLLVGAVDPSAAPPPLTALLAHLADLA